jgi:hypothetical protein
MDHKEQLLKPLNLGDRALGQSLKKGKGGMWQKRFVD